MRTLTVVGAAIVVLGMTGCGGEKHTIALDADGKKATVTTDQTGGKPTTTVEAPGAKASTGAGVQVSEAELGMPMYPGATAINGTKMAIEGAQTYTVTFSTTDGADKVMDFYKGKLPGANTMTMGSGSQAVMLYKEEGKNVYHVQAVAVNGKVTVTLVHAIKK